MPLVFSEYPGRRERHLLRKRNNPLFPDTDQAPTTEAVQEAQRLDHEELVDFIGKFRSLVQQAIGLKPSEESEVILKLKEDLDKAYEQACGLADDQTETKEAIKKLVGVIMNSVEAGAGNDQVALNELAQERIARAAHYELLEHPLVADLLYPESPIKEDELVPTLLSAPEAEFNAAISLFDAPQLRAILDSANELAAVKGCEEAGQRIKVLERLLRELSGGPKP